MSAAQDPSAGIDTAADKTAVAAGASAGGGLTHVQDPPPSNDQNLWMALGLVDVSERTFPRMI
jgi:hypothetical protein